MSDLQKSQQSTEHPFISYQWSSKDRLQHQCRIYTPPRFERDIQYPILYLLHGVKSTADDWHHPSNNPRENKGHLYTHIKELEAEKLIEPMIIVMPDAKPKGIPLNTLGFPDAEKFKEFFLEFMTIFEREYQSQPVDRKSRVIAGISMGGRQALEIATSNIGKFFVIGVFSGALQRMEEDGTSLNTIASELKKAKSDPEKSLKLFYLRCGKDDYEPIRMSNKTLVGSLPQSPEFDAPDFLPGGHNWIFWRPQLRKFLTKASHVLNHRDY